MSKEDIREGFGKWLRDGVAKIYEVSKDPYVVPKWDDMPDAQKEVYKGAALTGLMYLQSVGMIRKGDRDCSQCDGKGYTKIESTCPVCRGKKTESYTEELI